MNTKLIVSRQVRNAAPSLVFVISTVLIALYGCGNPPLSENQQDTETLPATIVEDQGDQPEVSEDPILPAEVEPTDPDSPDNVSPEPVYSPPVANAGKDQYAAAGDVVELDGTGSVAANNSPLKYKWIYLNEEPELTLEGANEPVAEFVVPDVDGDVLLEFVLTVTDGLSEDRTQVSVYIEDLSIASAGPTADAGADQTVEVGETVTLSGSASSGLSKEMLSFLWTQLSGPPVELSAYDQETVSFVASASEAGESLVFELTVEEDEMSSSDEVAIIVQSNTPEPPSNTVSTPPVVPPDPSCTADEDCDDGAYCNGSETCSGGVCLAGGDPCPGQLCDETDDVCVSCLADSDCSDGVFCNGFETCDTNGNCQAGSDPCPGQLCDETDAACVTCLVDGDCSDGLFCNGSETCDTDGNCQAGSDPCSGQMCNETTDTCVTCLADGDCSDGVYCNGSETCDTDGNCQAGGDPCPGQLCDETDDACVACLVNGDCSDGLFCNGSETCEDGTCMSGTAPCSAYEQCNDESDVCEGIVCAGGIAPFLPPQQTGSIASGAITEASGLAASRQNPGVLWTHNDSGGGNVVYAITTAGALVGTFTFGSGSVWDTEDISIGPGPEPGVDYLYWGDIGDNGNVRSNIVVRRAPEPAVDPNQDPVSDTMQDVELITLRYPTGTYAPSEKDAETFFVDPVNGDIYVVTKRAVPNKVYRAVYPQSTSSTTTLEWVTDLPSEFDGTPGSWNGGPTGGDVSPDGSMVAIRQYSWETPSAAIWYRPSGTDLANAFDEAYCTLQIQSDGAGEAICWDHKGEGIYTTQDEMSNAPLRFYERNTD